MSDEKHDRKFRGVWIPAWVFNMMDDDSLDLRPRDILMYATIDSLCDDEKGCWASNKYLAERLRITEDMTSRIVSKLRRLGMVKMEHYDGRHRHLFVCHDRNTGDRIRKSEGSNSKSDSGKRPSRTRGNAQVGLGETPKSDMGHSPSPYIETKGEAKEEQRRLLGAEKTRPPKNGESLLFETKKVRRSKPNPHLSEFDRKAASRLKRIVAENNETSLHSIREETIAERVRRLREKGGIEEKEIKAWIVWLREHYADEDVSKFRRADDFFDHYKRHADAMCRKQNGSFNGRHRLTRETMWNEPDNVLPGGMALKVEIGPDGCEYDGRLLYDIRRRVLERFGSGLPLPEELKAVLEEDFPDVESLTPSIIGSVG